MQDDAPQTDGQLTHGIDLEALQGGRQEANEALETRDCLSIS